MSSNHIYIITEQQRLNFKPTYLYIKKHKDTGLKYFGKTNRNPYKYNGSGSHWKNHLKKHGNNINTIWIHLFTDINKLVSVAITLSELFDIVESNSWANMKIEDGLSGGDVSHSENFKNSMKTLHKNKKPSDYATFGMLGKTQSNKFLSAIKKSNQCPVNCDGIEYSSVGEAQKHYPGINIRKRLDNPKYPMFFRLRERTKRK